MYIFIYIPQWMHMYPYEYTCTPIPACTSFTRLSNSNELNVPSDVSTNNGRRTALEGFISSCIYIYFIYILKRKYVYAHTCVYMFTCICLYVWQPLLVFMNTNNSRRTALEGCISSCIYTLYICLNTYVYVYTYVYMSICI